MIKLGFFLAGLIYLSGTVAFLAISMENFRGGLIPQSLRWQWLRTQWRVLLWPLRAWPSSVATIARFTKGS